MKCTAVKRHLNTCTIDDDSRDYEGNSLIKLYIIFKPIKITQCDFENLRKQFLSLCKFIDIYIIYYI